ncbi:serine hydrolase domain-containing protein [Leadbettera azotonutricia]|uniref:Beta-lactamase n=1 Tax=Leadbettera azotonutricia (strain ATCC BAA-888 / DSM 13862 / ZAS-9) TaxID=545695 RepID=F5YD47_LEAAZ|nr:serine hydrolase domain-containing protein [Leadbettera azotonutricia]AEF81365.1 beta-lactamase [Leadbettera azotonutricia ZAS-9]
MKTEGSGLCPKRLKNAEAYLKRIVDQGKVAGAGGMIIRHGVEGFCASAGFQDREKKTPMKDDSIYRIYSMSKTFTIVAAMTLYEKGLFRLHQPIADFLPAFKDPKVAIHDERGQATLVPAKRPITFEHLFTMTSGIPYPGENSYSARIMADTNKKSFKDAAKGKPWNTAKTVDEAAKTPLCFHPGDQWMYGFSHDILGRLIEVISGKTLGQYLKETIFDPLGLKDTAFYIPKEKQLRAVKPYRLGPKGLELVTDLGSDPASPTPPAFESGGGGLNSTMADCGRYAQMLLHDGKSGNERILSRKTLELIRASHCIPSEMASDVFPHLIGYGYGLGVRTMLDTAKAGLNGSLGEWAWDGMMGTYYCVDPAEDLTALFFIQLMSDINSDLQRGFVQTVYGAIDD